MVIRGELKSSISLLSKMPVEEDMTLEPKLREERGDTTQHYNLTLILSLTLILACVAFSVISVLAQTEQGIIQNGQLEQSSFTYNKNKQWCIKPHKHQLTI